MAKNCRFTGKFMPLCGKIDYGRQGLAVNRVFFMALQGSRLSPGKDLPTDPSMANPRPIFIARKR
jgi:hypothetical protein